MENAATQFLEGPPPPLTGSSGGIVADSASLPTDLNTDVVGDGSCVVTFEPFSPSVDSSARGARPPNSSRNRRNKKATKNHDNRSVQVAPGIFEPNDFNKYLTVVLDKSEADIFDVHRDLVTCCGSEPKVYDQGSGRILV